VARGGTKTEFRCDRQILGKARQLERFPLTAEGEECSQEGVRKRNYKNDRKRMIQEPKDAAWLRGIKEKGTKEESI